MDELLEWPFTKRVGVTLFDQSDDVQSRQHVSHTIDPNFEMDETVSRATNAGSERRSPFGVEQFIRLEQLNMPNTYIRDDVVLFGFSIDD